MPKTPQVPVLPRLPPGDGQAELHR